MMIVLPCITRKQNSLLYFIHREPVVNASISVSNWLSLTERTMNKH